MSALEWHVTGLWYPGETEVEYVGRIATPQDDEVPIVLNNSRRAKVTLRMDSDYNLVHTVMLEPRAYMLQAYFRNKIHFWGPIQFIEGSLKDGLMTLHGLDQSIRLIHHQLRRGDLAGIAEPGQELRKRNDDRGSVSIDHVGLRLLRDAGNNTAEQTAAGVPDLGIIDGTNDFVADPEALMGVTRGDQVWNAMTQLSESLGPDFELEPIDNTVGAYCKLNTYIQQGTDVSDEVQFHFGTGLKNVEDMTFTDGTEYVTHAHVLDRGNLYRFTEANSQARARTGPYVRWDTTDFDVGQTHNSIAAAYAEPVLRAHGQNILKAYSQPLIVITVTLPLDRDSDLHFGEDYKIGDIIGFAGKSGDFEMYDFGASLPHRIIGVTLKGESEDTRPILTVVPDRTVGDSILDTES